MGYGKSAGEATRLAFGDLSRAGGHRAMAKGVIDLKDWQAEVGELSPEALQHGITQRVFQALGGHHQE
ncbi:MAG: hypothetical protein ACE5FK_04745 [Candidatus Methylomirabilia bacterium]